LQALCSQPPETVETRSEVQRDGPQQSVALVLISYWGDLEFLIVTEDSVILGFAAKLQRAARYSGCGVC